MTLTVDAGKPLITLLNGLKDSIIDHDITLMDAITLQILNVPEVSVVLTTP